MSDYASKVKLPGTFDFTRSDDSASSFWIEQIGNQSPSGVEMSSKFGRATLYAYIPDGEQQYYNFAANLLGYSVTLADKTIHRVNPQQHPKYPNLFATKISSCEGVVYRSREDGRPPPSQVADGIKQYAKYKRNLVAVEFSPLRYPIYEDSAPEVQPGTTTGEYRRNVDYDTTTNVYDVVIPTGQYKFAEGTSGAPNGNSFPGELNFFEVKTTFELKWRNVPADFVYDTINYQLGYPVKSGAAAGRVNSTAIWGYPAGTLLLLEPQIERNASPVLTSSDGRSPFFICDVMLPIIHFDPPNLGTYKGHNLKPWWKTGDTTITYYLVTNNGDPTKIRIYGEYEFSNLFKHWAA